MSQIIQIGNLSALLKDLDHELWESMICWRCELLNVRFPIIEWGRLTPLSYCFALRDAIDTTVMQR